MKYQILFFLFFWGENKIEKYFQMSCAELANAGNLREILIPVFWKKKKKKKKNRKLCRAEFAHSIITINSCLL